MSVKKVNKRQKLASSSPWMRQHKWRLAFGVVLFTAILFLPSLQNDFVNWDDPDYILVNEYIHEVSAENIWHIATQPVAHNYHPLTMYSLMLDYQLWGENAFGYHLLNLLVHLSNVFLLFYFVYLLSRGRVEIALITALLFGIHPMHVESVAWVSERKDVLYVFFMLLSFIHYLQYLRKRNWGYYGLAILWAALSMFSKPSAVVIPLLLLCIDFYLRRKVRLKFVLDKIPFFALAIIFGLLTIHAQTVEGVVGKDFTFFQRLSFASYGFVMYLVKLVFPFKMTAFYPYPISTAKESLPMIYNLMPLLAAVIIGGVAWSWQKSRLLVFAFAFYFFNIALVLQFVSVGKAIMADRYTYMAYTGLFFAIGYGFHQLYYRKRAYRQALQIGLGIWVVFLSVLSFQQIKIWKNGETMWGDAIAKYPVSMVYTTRGDFYFNNQQYDEAFADFSKAIEMNPQKEYDAYNLRGNIHRRKKRHTDAMADYRKAMTIQPSNFKALLNLGNTYFELNQNEEAFNIYTQILRKTPNDANALCNRGAIFFKKQDYDSALRDLSKAIQLDDDYFDAYMNRGVVYCVSKRFEEGIQDYNRCLAIRPNAISILRFRASAYQELENYAAAIQNFNQLIQLRPENATFYVERSKAHFSMGNKAAALQDATKARELGGKVNEAYWRSLQ